MLARDWKPGRPLWLYEKDRAHLADALAGTELDLPIAREVFERMYALIAAARANSTRWRSTRCSIPTPRYAA